MLDTITLYAIVTVVAAAGAALTGYFSTQRAEAVGTRAWAAGIGCLALFFLTSLLRAFVPPFISFAVGNAVAITGLGVMHVGACQITRRPWPLWWHAAAAVIVGLLVTVFWLDPEGGYRARVTVVGLVTCAQSAVICITLWQEDAQIGSEELYARRLAVSVFAMLGLLQLLRVLMHLPGAPAMESSFLADTTTSRATAATFLVICLALPFLVVYMNEARARHALRHTIGQLQHALAEVKTLRGLIPICSSCRRIRETDQTWMSIERYLDAHTDVQLSHGVCPDCMRKLYPEFADKILNG